MRHKQFTLINAKTGELALQCVLPALMSKASATTTSWLGLNIVHIYHNQHKIGQLSIGTHADVVCDVTFFSKGFAIILMIRYKIGLREYKFSSDGSIKIIVNKS